MGVATSSRSSRWSVFGLVCCFLLHHGVHAQATDSPPKILTVAAYPSVDAIVKAAIPAWQKLHPDVEIKVVSRQYYDHHPAMTTALSTSSNLPDVMALEVDYVGRFAQGEGLEDLSQTPYNINRFESKFVPYAWNQAVNRRGKIIAVPTDIGPGTLLYRTDLLKRAGVTEAELTRTWESFVEAGVKIKEATGAYLIPHAREMKDIVIRTGIKPGEGLYFDSRSNALATTPRFRRAFVLAKSVRDKKLDAGVMKWSGDWIEGFKRGNIAAVMSGSWLAGHLNNWMAPNTRGLWHAAQLPEGAYAAYGGTFYAIPRSAAPQNKPIAWELIKMLTMDRAMQLSAFKSEDSFPALQETFDDPFFEQPISFLGGQPGRAVWREATKHINAVMVHKQDPFAEEVIDTELDKVLNYGKDIDTALADAQRLLQQRANR